MTRLRLPAIAAFAALATLAAPALAGDTPAPEGAKVYFINLENGDTVSSPVLIQFGLSNAGVAPAGIEKPGTGHHHLVINAELTEEDLANSLPADDNHRHFGGGQTEAVIELPAGQHTLQLVLADHNHVPHAPPVMSERITITVE